MSSQIYFHTALIAFGTMLATSSVLAIVFFTEPQTAKLGTFIILYTSVFLAVLGFFMVAGLLIRTWFVKTLYAVNAKHAFRQALLMAIFAVLTLVLNAHGWFNIWIEGTLVLLLLAIEIFVNVG